MEIKVKKAPEGYWLVVVESRGTFQFQYRRNSKGAAIDKALAVEAQYSFNDPKMTFDLRG